MQSRKQRRRKISRANNNHLFSVSRNSYRKPKSSLSELKANKDKNSIQKTLLDNVPPFMLQTEEVSDYYVSYKPKVSSVKNS